MPLGVIETKFLMIIHFYRTILIIMGMKIPVFLVYFHCGETLESITRKKTQICSVHENDNLNIFLIIFSKILIAFTLGNDPSQIDLVRPCTGIGPIPNLNRLLNFIFYKKGIEISWLHEIFRNCSNT